MPGFHGWANVICREWNVLNCNRAVADTPAFRGIILLDKWYSRSRSLKSSPHFSHIPSQFLEGFSSRWESVLWYMCAERMFRDLGCTHSVSLWVCALVYVWGKQCSVNEGACTLSVWQLDKGWKQKICTKKGKMCVLQGCWWLGSHLHLPESNRRMQPSTAQLLLLPHDCQLSREGWSTWRKAVFYSSTEQFCSKINMYRLELLKSRSRNCHPNRWLCPLEGPG